MPLALAADHVCCATDYLQPVHGNQLVVDR